MTKLRIGVQLIIWGERIGTDILGVLDEASSIGYEGIECGPDALSQVSDPKEALSSRGLDLVGFHMGIGFVDAKDVEKALVALESLGGRYLTFSGAGGRENSDENYLENSRRLQEFGKLAKKHGVKVCYHNHWQEIVDDERGTRLILENTDPEYVSLCVDTYWVKHGGGDPVGFLEEHGDRVAYIHLKDGTEEGMKKTPPEFVELGRGIIDFAAVIEKAKSLGVDWGVVEQDRTSLTPKESMAISRRYLREALGL